MGGEGCRAWGMPAALLIFVGQAYFLAARDPITPLLVALFAGLFNLGGDLLLCNVFNLGIAGASAATSFAQVRHSSPFPLPPPLHALLPPPPFSMPFPLPPLSTPFPLPLDNRRERDSRGFGDG